MSDEMKYALALLFKKVRPNPTRRDLVLTASMSLRWFSPAVAEQMVTMAIAEGYLKSEGGVLSLTFDPATVQIPSGFTPTPEMIKTRKNSDSLLMKIIQAISDRTNEDKKKIMAGINALVRDMNIDVEVAAVILLLESGGDVNAFISDVRAEIMKRYGVKE